MKKTSYITIYFIVLLILLRIPFALAQSPEGVGKQYNSTNTCNHPNILDCTDTFRKPDLETIKLSPKIRSQENNKKNDFSPNDLVPFIGGSAEVR